MGERGQEPRETDRNVQQQHAQWGFDLLRTMRFSRHGFREKPAHSARNSSHKRAIAQTAAIHCSLSFASSLIKLRVHNSVYISYRTAGTRVISAERIRRSDGTRIWIIAAIERVARQNCDFQRIAQLLWGQLRNTGSKHPFSPIRPDRKSSRTSTSIDPASEPESRADKAMRLRRHDRTAGRGSLRESQERTEIGLGRKKVRPPLDA